MTIETINTGSSANAGNGDSIRTAFNKINSNFSEIVSILNTSTGGGGGFGPTGPAGPTGPQGEVGPTGPSNFLGIDSSITPIASNQYDLGSPSQRWRSIYLGTSTIYFGGSATLSANNRGQLVHNSVPIATANINSQSTSSYSPLAFYSSEGAISPLNSFVYSRTTETRVLTYGGAFTNTFQILLGNTQVDPTFRVVQAHETPDAVNVSFARSRGTLTAPTMPNVGDEIAELAFDGWDGFDYRPGMLIASTVEAVSPGHISGSFRVSADNGTTYQTILYASSTGTVRFNKLGHLITSNFVEVDADLIPNSNNVRKLGSETMSWSVLYANTASVSQVRFQDNTVQTTAYILGTPPETSTSTGVANTLAYNEGFMYVCTATNSWQRVAWDVTPW